MNGDDQCRMSINRFPASISHSINLIPDAALRRSRGLSIITSITFVSKLIAHGILPGISADHSVDGRAGVSARVHHLPGSLAGFLNALSLAVISLSAISFLNLSPDARLAFSILARRGVCPAPPCSLSNQISFENPLSGSCARSGLLPSAR